FESIGQELPALTRLEYQRADYAAGEMQGVIPVLDPNYGNVWSNIPKAMVTKHFNNRQKFHVTIFDGQKQVYAASLPLVDTFSGVMKGKPLLYFNSLLNLSLALNQGDFARKFKIGSGPNWRVRVRGD
nr:SAM-dependent chlorinase/fluorinase [Bdellovibrionales bacterium]